MCSTFLFTPLGSKELVRNNKIRCIVRKKVRQDYFACQLVGKKKKDYSAYSDACIKCVFEMWQ